MIAEVVTATALAAPPAALFGHRAVRRLQGARALRIDSPRGIDEQGFVRIGGIEQWVSVRGEDRANPVIVEVHGGPGAPNSIYAVRTRAWEQHFTIVRWDMRGAGKTFGRGGPEGQGDATFARLYEDALEVVGHARRRLGVRRVVLVANSFGSVFGLRLVRNHPELFSAYVGTDQNVPDADRDACAYRDLLERLRAAGKTKQLARAEALGADQRAWSAGQRATYDRLRTQSDPLTLDTLKKVVLGSMWLSPLHTLRDLRDYFKGQHFSERVAEGTTGLTDDHRGDQADDHADDHTDDQADDQADDPADETADETGTRFEVPFFVFQGELDVLTPPERAKAFFDAVEAPLKHFALIGGASHFASFRRPEAFLELLLTHVRPAVTAERVQEAPQR
ncbi:alpha/beta fold hydrolase [Streptomyces sp. NBC_00539]|uniref:alpha/beta fold hydrolase n=1 Tax=Streptomyces sp. NBC_00539 TaxID=2975770 RepID=UPI002E80EE3D|nr:alpha/beta hydrolase [Streptomyces sp. NBC_00539]WUC65214.1 alpha/beta hydrolase [Streptomyces sp. NBC_00539]